MEAKVYQFMADGFEDVEALIPVDVLRRGGVDIKTVSIMGRLEVESAHGVTIKADMLFEDADLSDADLLMLPGGMPGASNLDAHEGLKAALLKQAEAGKKISAICAAPFVLGKLGILKGKRATCLFHPCPSYYRRDCNRSGYWHALCAPDDGRLRGITHP